MKEGRAVYILFSTSFTNAPADAEIENINLAYVKLSVPPPTLRNCRKGDRKPTLGSVLRDGVE